jgi:hypothetical protein
VYTSGIHWKSFTTEPLHLNLQPRGFVALLRDHHGNWHLYIGNWKCSRLVTLDQWGMVPDGSAVPSGLEVILPMVVSLARLLLELPSFPISYAPGPHVLSWEPVPQIRIHRQALVSSSAFQWEFRSDMEPWIRTLSESSQYWCSIINFSYYQFSSLSRLHCWLLITISLVFVIVTT